LEISSLEIDLLCRKIDSAIGDFTLSAVYQIERGILLRLHHATKQEILIAVSSFATWLTTKNLSLPSVEPFVSRIRERIERTKLTSVNQEGNERIAKFVFTDRRGEVFNLYAEFFGGGNLVLTDAKGVIVDVEFPKTFRHRNLVPGEKYILPPMRGKNLLEVDETWLGESLKGSQDGIPAINWFGRNVATSRKFVEEIFFRSGVDPRKPVSELAPEQLKSIAKAARELLAEVESSSSGYILLPKEMTGDLEIDVCSIVTKHWKDLADASAAEIKQFPSLSEVLDEAQVHILVMEKRQKASKEIRSKAGELESAIQKQDALLKKNEETSRELRTFATELMSGKLDQKSRELIGKLESLGIVELDEHRDLLRFASEPREYFRSFQTPRALGSRLFDEAKILEKSNQNIVAIKSELQRKMEALLKQTEISEERAEKRAVLERRARQWFERFRWFLTSDMRLAIGGRDSTSNSVIINKHMEGNDLVFHADLHGSPFFVLKNDSQNPAQLDSQTEFEVAQTTVSFSRAWKDELGSADAYWVRPQQVKKSAPSGEYLPRGSFFIEGKKEFVRHLKVELVVGVMKASDLPNSEHTAENTDKIVIVCGPEKALARYCIAWVKIAPGKERANSAGRRIKQLLVGKTKQDPKATEAVKKIPIDEIIRALPSGSYKLVSEKQDFRGAR
jgi:predicted ribosome quality control (RQC) complex YloA/Tae2 family protein